MLIYINISLCITTATNSITTIYKSMMSGFSLCLVDLEYNDGSLWAHSVVCVFVHIFLFHTAPLLPVHRSLCLISFGYLFLSASCCV